MKKGVTASRQLFRFASIASNFLTLVFFEKLIFILFEDQVTVNVIKAGMHFSDIPI